MLVTLQRWRASRALLEHGPRSRQVVPVARLSTKAAARAETGSCPGGGHISRRFRMLSGSILESKRWFASDLKVEVSFAAEQVQ